MMQELKTAIASRIAEAQPFAGPPSVTVVSERLGDWLNRIQVALNEGGVGLAVVVGTPLLEKQQSGRLHFQARVPIHVWENVPLNQGESGRRVSAEDAVLAILGILTGHQPAGGWTPLEAMGNITPADNTKEGLVMFELVMVSTITFRPVPQ